MKAERWRAVPGYESLYEVSDRGQVRSRFRMLKPTLTKDGYPVVHLSNKHKRHVKVHRLVLLAFVGPCPAGKQARHYPDPDRTNNRLGNLSWATPFVNQRDRDAHGTNNKGVRNASAKLSPAAVRAVRRVKSWPYGTLIALARKYKVSPTAIAWIRDGKTWKPEQT